MSAPQRHPNLKSHFPQAMVATLLVLGLPLFAVMWLGASGLVTSTPNSIIVGVVLSFGTGSLGSALWMRFSRSSDLVFGDLMLWGWLRRYFLEKRIMRSATLLSGIDEGSAATPNLERQSRILHKLASSLESADPYTHGHSRRVARHAYMIAKRMGLDVGESALIRTAAAIHDVGKLRVPTAILHKPGRLTDKEFDEIKRHPVAGADMVAILGNERLTAIVRHHHERLDGGGYPDGLVGNQIPLGARIIAVADTFDAITSARPYRTASRHKKAIEIIRKEAGTQLDPHAVEAFLHYYGGRRSITLWALLTSAPHRALEATSGLMRKTLSAGITNAVSASTAAVVVGTAVFVTGAGLQPPVSRFAVANPDKSITVENDIAVGAEQKPASEKDRDRERSQSRADREDRVTSAKGSDDPYVALGIRSDWEHGGESTLNDPGSYQNPIPGGDSGSGDTFSDGSGDGEGSGPEDDNTGAGDGDGDDQGEDAGTYDGDGGSGNGGSGNGGSGNGGSGNQGEDNEGEDNEGSGNEGEDDGDDGEPGEGDDDDDDGDDDDDDGDDDDDDGDDDDDDGDDDDDDGDDEDDD